MELTAQAVEELVVSFLEKRQVKYCGVKVSGRMGRPLIQLFIDWEESPITIEACARISRELIDLFDMQERFALDYRLEVSSPGIDAPLREAWQFRRNIGRTIGWDEDGQHVEAEVLDVAADGITRLEIDGSILEKPLAELIGAKVVLFAKKQSISKRKRNEARGS